MTSKSQLSDDNLLLTKYAYATSDMVLDMCGRYLGVVH